MDSSADLSGGPSPPEGGASQPIIESGIRLFWPFMKRRPWRLLCLTDASSPDAVGYVAAAFLTRLYSPPLLSLEHKASQALVQAQWDTDRLLCFSHLVFDRCNDLGVAMVKTYRCCLLEVRRTVVVQSVESDDDAGALLKLCSIIAASNVQVAELWDGVRMVAVLSGKPPATQSQPAYPQATASRPLAAPDHQERRVPVRRHASRRRTASGMQRGSPAR